MRSFPVGFIGNRFRLGGLAACILAALLAWFLFAGASDSPAPRKVRLVPDGDTLILEDGQLVRLIGINAPEADTPEGPAEPFGIEAREALRALVSTGPVVQEKDREQKDRFGRTLAYVFLPDGSMANERMLAQGLAWALSISPNSRYTDKFLAVQQDAMTRSEGLWRAIPSLPGPFVGNARTRRFHDPACPYAQGLSRKNRFPFQSLAQAFHQGHAPCKSCLHDRIMDAWKASLNLSPN